MGATFPWELDDTLTGKLAEKARPAFRITLHFGYRSGHPYRLVDAYENLFACFAPIIRERCGKLVMWDRPGDKARKGLTIKPGDWTPFRHLASVHDDPANGIFIGFSFIDATDADKSGCGPCSFRFFVGSRIRLDACIPLADWRAGKLDITAVKDAALRLPFASLIGGYSLSLSDVFANGAATAMCSRLMPVAARFPAIDIVHPELHLSGGETAEDLGKTWLAGIGWLTGVGAPYLAAVGGAGAVTQGLDPAVTAQAGASTLLLQLGESPVTGAAGIDDATLPLFSQVGRRLRPSRFLRRDSDGTYLAPDPFLDPPESLRWARRFYD